MPFEREFPDNLFELWGENRSGKIKRLGTPRDEGAIVPAFLQWKKAKRYRKLFLFSRDRKLKLEEWKL